MKPIECIKHRVVQISYEAIYPFAWSIVPSREEYTFGCSCCGYRSILTTYPDQKSTVTSTKN